MLFFDLLLSLANHNPRKDSACFTFMKSEKDKKKFEAFYEAESDGVFRYCLLRTSSREQALDMTQEIFTRSWRAMAEGKEIPNMRAYIYTVAHNLVVDWYRKSKPVSLDELLDGNAEEDVAPYDPVDSDAHLNIEIDSDAKRAFAMLASLKPEYKEAVYLRFVEGLRPSEIAEILGLNNNAVSIRITRGLEELRNLLKIEKEK